MKITGTVIEFDLYDVLKEATAEQCRDIADALSLNDDVRRNVVDSLLNYETDMHSGPTRDAADVERKRILDSLTQITDDRIAKLESDLERSQTQLAEKEATISRLWALTDRATRAICKEELLVALIGK